MSETYSPYSSSKDSLGGASCGASPLSLNITNHIHDNVAFGQSTVTSPVKMSLFGDYKPVKLKKNDYQAYIEAPKKKAGDLREMKLSKTQTSSLTMVTSASGNQTNHTWHSTVYARKRSKNHKSNTKKRSLCKPIICRHLRRSHL
mmetsp:Transcript_12829/g.19347  ORF Transcript_12829/g.19347 Transcript_12829/m.19347 type:complete len:145 (-) Transcript_12829:437-871(-)